MFTQKMTMCLVGLALLSIATMSCSKKQSASSIDNLPYTATIQGRVVYNNAALTPAIVNAPMADDSVFVVVTIGTTGQAKTIITKTDASGVFKVSVPVAINWTTVVTNVSVQIASKTIGNDTYSFTTALTQNSLIPSNVYTLGTGATPVINMLPIGRVNP